MMGQDLWAFILVYLAILSQAYKPKVHRGVKVQMVAWGKLIGIDLALLQEGNGQLGNGKFGWWRSLFWWMHLQITVGERKSCIWSWVKYTAPSRHSPYHSPSYDNMYPFIGTLARVAICDKVFNVQRKEIRAGSEVLAIAKTEKESMPIIGLVLDGKARCIIQLLVVLAGKYANFERYRGNIGVLGIPAKVKYEEQRTNFEIVAASQYNREERVVFNILMDSQG